MRRTPDWLVERLAAGDLDPAEAGAVEARLEAEGGLERLADVARSNRELLAQLPPGPAIAEIRRRQEGAGSPTRRSTLRRALLVAVPAAAAVAVLVVLSPAATGPAPDTERAKGAPRLLLDVRRGTSAVRLGPGAAARAGEHLQIGYEAAGRPFGAIVSIDGGGSVTLHWPEREGEAPVLAAGPTALSRSFELDDAPAFERFFLVTADRPFEVADLLVAARTLAGDPDTARSAPLPLARGLEQAAVLVRKEAP